MTNPLIRKYLLLYARPMLYSTSLPHAHIAALHTTFDFVTSPAGVEVSLKFYCTRDRPLTFSLAPR